MKKVVIIDGHNLLFRMFYGIPSSIKNQKGHEIKGLVGFISSLKKIVNEFNPYSMIVIFDSETSRSANLEIDASYKANRTDFTNVKEEENPFSQLPLIKKALDFLGIFHLEVENAEADDYIASITSNITKYSYIIVSTDSDFIQLVSSTIYLYVPRGKQSVLYDKKEVLKKYNVPPTKYVMYKSLVGDKSDNIKGIKGIGPTTAVKILTYDALNDFILKSPESKIKQLLLEQKDTITKNNALIAMNKNLDTSSVELKKLSTKISDLKTYEIIEGIGEK